MRLRATSAFYTNSSRSFEVSLWELLLRKSAQDTYELMY